ncbi:hypothetical protein SAMD00019534_006760 [Acytostelium subglobosum LB1]|uniref:hypothetical protein n=1 Tax=Acytostelium subglobosum LB1 TaxID=1410327 RepID=UPI000644AF67|nr:hypothetical protein SAMD00019534_006760 [Acytostelium subglobosum LB1]GAM17501.1 hypothetical protein SAMD00019534_006760 [Acytostelium subglobosum LB1]|eukprot:XP_012759563.1 hypothetical protein SAMD00019534_006760 [Acytostelium subglobosum LB1]
MFTNKFSVLSTSDDTLDRDSEVNNVNYNNNNNTMSYSQPALKRKASSPSSSPSKASTTSTTSTSTTSQSPTKKKTADSNRVVTESDSSSRCEIELIAHNKKQLNAKDIQHFMLWTLSDSPGQVPTPGWVTIKNKHLLDKVVMVSVPSISLDLFQKVCDITHRSWFHDKLPHTVTMSIMGNGQSQPPHPSIYNPLLNVKLSKHHSQQGGSPKSRIQ